MFFTEQRHDLHPLSEYCLKLTDHVNVLVPVKNAALMHHFRKRVRKLDNAQVRGVIQSRLVHSICSTTFGPQVFDNNLQTFVDLSDYCKIWCYVPILQIFLNTLNLTNKIDLKPQRNIPISAIEELKNWFAWVFYYNKIQRLQKCRVATKVLQQEIAAMVQQ